MSEECSGGMSGNHFAVYDESMQKQYIIIMVTVSLLRTMVSVNKVVKLTISKHGSGGCVYSE